MRLRLRVVPACLAPLGYLRRRRRLLTSWPAADRLADMALEPRVALFCHYDRTGAANPAVLAYLSALRAAGFCPVVICNAGRLQADALAALRGVAGAVLLRANSGHDFGAWAEALHRLCLPRPDTQAVLLANDSVLGPIGALGPLFDRLDLGTADVWGLTDSTQWHWHLQSYFLLAGRRALTSAAWRDFWAGVRPVPSKQWTVWQGEIALSRRLTAAGLKLAAAWPSAALLAGLDQTALARLGASGGPAPEAIYARRLLAAALGGPPINPTTDLWQALLNEGFPFLKRELLRDDPGRTGAATTWRAAVAARGSVDPAVLQAMAAEAGETEAGET